MKICFLICVDEVLERTQMFGVRYMPVWAYTLAAHMRSQADVEIKLHDGRIRPEIDIPESDLYFYSALNQDLAANLKLLAKLRGRFPRAKHALGGPATGSLKIAGRLDEVAAFDAIYLGEGETEAYQFAKLLLEHDSTQQLVYESRERFQLASALPMDFELLSSTFMDYYGGVIEVSRGCPFLCEFCDIRTLPDNNKAHVKPVQTILADLEQFHRLGVTNVLFACDNFIGNLKWASELCDAMIEFNLRTGYRPRLYTWLTINIANHPDLMLKMKSAGFDMFFIGVESFGIGQLLETAKVQNTKFDIPDAVRKIQSFGIVVVAGLIFGFDTDTDDTTDQALTGILASGLISGDPTLLTALSGTPLYRRMQLAGRLRDGKVALGGQKYSTNIRYLRPKARIINDYIRFVKTFNSASFQLRRYRSFLNCFSAAPRQLARDGGYIQPGKILGLVRRNPKAMKSALTRLGCFLRSPKRVGAILVGAYDTLRIPEANWSHFFFWVFNWSNSIMKYGQLSSTDFDIESIDRPITRQHILPAGYETDLFEPIPIEKIRAQRQITISALEKIAP